MSAFLVTDEHIHALVQAAFARMRHGAESVRVYDADGGFTSFASDEQDRLGALLRAANVAGMSACYSGAARDWSLETVPYKYKAPRKARSAIEIIKAIHCFGYQCCDAEDWTGSVAHNFCQQLEHELVCSLPGYDAASWGVES